MTLHMLNSIKGAIHDTQLIALYLLYPCLLSGGSVLDTPEAAKDMQGICHGVHAVQHYDT